MTLLHSRSFTTCLYLRLPSIKWSLSHGERWTTIETSKSALTSSDQLSFCLTQLNVFRACRLAHAPVRDSFLLRYYLSILWLWNEALGNILFAIVAPDIFIVRQVFLFNNQTFGQQMIFACLPAIKNKRQMVSEGDSDFERKKKSWGELFCQHFLDGYGKVWQGLAPR